MRELTLMEHLYCEISPTFLDDQVQRESERKHIEIGLCEFSINISRYKKDIILER